MTCGDVCRIHVVIELTGDADHSQEKMFDITVLSFGLNHLQSTVCNPTKYVIVCVTLIITITCP